MTGRSPSRPRWPPLDPPLREPPPPPVVADITLLFMGNSHTSANDLTTMVADMVSAGEPGQSVAWASDGNHSSPSGAFLAALVLYATITEQSPLELPPMPQFPVDASLQDTLRGIAAETVETVPPRMWCPGDAGRAQKL